MKFIRITIFTAFLLSLFGTSYCSEEQSVKDEPTFESIDVKDAIATVVEQPKIARKKSFDGTRDAWTGGIVGSGYWTLDHYGQDYGSKVCAIGSDDKTLERWSIVADELVRAKDIIRIIKLLEALKAKEKEFSQDRMMNLRALSADEQDETVKAQSEALSPNITTATIESSQGIVFENSNKNKQVQDSLVVAFNQLAIDQQNARAKVVCKDLSLKKSIITQQKKLNNLTDEDLAKLFPDLSKNAQKQIQKVESQQVHSNNKNNKKKKNK